MTSRISAPIAMATMIVLGCLVGPVTGPAGADAATITVTTTVDGGAGSLRAAFAQANAEGGAATIVLAADQLYPLTDCDEGALASTTGPLTIIGHGSTIKQTCPFTGVVHQSAAAGLSASGLTVTGGNYNHPYDIGAGIYSAGPVTLMASTVTLNVALASAGIASLTGPTTLIDSRVTANTSSTGAAGISSEGLLRLEDSSVDHNVGGGINAFRAQLVRSKVNGNSGGIAGGITADNDVTLTDSEVSGNRGGEVGGIALYEGTVSLLRSTVAHNVAGEQSGGIGAPSVLLDHSAVIANRVESTERGGSGGIGPFITQRARVGSVTVRHSTVSGNVGGNGSGGVSAAGPVVLLFATIADNTAQGASAVHAGTTLTSFGSVIAAGTGGPPCHASETYSDGYNLEQGANSCGFTNTTDRPNGPDPQLLGLAPDNGPTPSHLFATASVVHDAIPSEVPACAGTDQRAVPRPQGPGCDLGAVELRLPTARDEATTTPAGVEVTTDLGPLVDDPDGWLVGATYHTAIPPQHGATAPAGHDTIRYTPEPGFVGQDRYRYEALDSRNLPTTSALITITVTGTTAAPPAAPVASDPRLTG